MKVGEYGINFVLGVGYNISGFSSLTLTFTKPDGTTLVVTDPAVAVGSGDIVTELGTFADETYATYTFQSGDVDQDGEWSVILTYVDGSKQLFSDVARFTIDDD